MAPARAALRLLAAAGLLLAVAPLPSPTPAQEPAGQPPAGQPRASQPPAAVGSRIGGTVIDSLSAEPVVAATVRLVSLGPDRRRTGQMTTGAGYFDLELPGTAACSLYVDAFGYRPWAGLVAPPAQRQRPLLEVRLTPAPLAMDEVLVRGKRSDAAIHGPSFVETLELDPRQVGVDLGTVLDGAVGVHTKSTGGLGSFSTVSVRGSTAEQVQVYLDGVPLNQAVGGGVDLGDLPVTGVESVEVYRGAVPGRFGGNSIGGVIHIRTREPGDQQHLRVQGLGGTWGTATASASASGRLGQRRYLALAEFSQSDNDFTFLDDNGTEYNLADDRRTRRLNNDFRSVRVLAKLDQGLGQSRLQWRSVLEDKRQGIPSISNNQSLSTRLNKRRASEEAELFGSVPGWSAAGYRLNAYYLVQEYEYRDLEGTVGVGYQHDRNRTTGYGLRSELDYSLLGALVTLFGSGGQERFAPRNLLRPQSQLLTSRRRSAAGGWEAELPLLGDLLRLNGGSQWQVLDDRFYGDGMVIGGAAPTPRERTQTIASGRVGAQLGPAPGVTLKGHLGWHCRPPNFYELFGDRGAVKGNPALKREHGQDWDAGLSWQPPATGSTRLLLEAVYFDNQVDELIRFVQNAQRVSVAHNIGSSRVRGLELRGDLSLPARLRLAGNYSYQVPENQTDAAYERGKDLPNAPRHTVNGQTAWAPGPWQFEYQFSHESQHYLDRANLRTVAARTIHGVQARRRLEGGLEAGLEVRNLTDNQIADLWGYPLPGRSVFATLAYSLDLGGTPAR